MCERRLPSSFCSKKQRLAKSLNDSLLKLMACCSFLLAPLSIFNRDWLVDSLFTIRALREDSTSFSRGLDTTDFFFPA